MTRTDRSDPRTSRARRLRGEATPQERKLWAQLKLLDVEGHFRRQAPVGPYFADFAHHQRRLIVELDGGQHGEPDGQKRDARRTAYLEAAGYRVLRFWNSEVRENLDGVIETIFATLTDTPPTPSPSPPQAGGGEAPSSPPSHLTGSIAERSAHLPPPACGEEGLRVGGAYGEAMRRRASGHDVPPTPIPSPPQAGGGECASPNGDADRL